MRKFDLMTASALERVAIAALMLAILWLAAAWALA
jgi:hypothetical protein